jgi:hypothetical protein
MILEPKAQTRLESNCGMLLYRKYEDYGTG